MSKGKTETAPIAWAQAQMLIKSLSSDGEHHNALFFCCGFYFGLRIGDLLRIEWKHLEKSQFKLDEKKTGKTRTITVNDEVKKYAEKAKQAIRRASEMNGYVFVSQRTKGDKTKPISVTAANKRIRTIFEKYGIEAQNPSSHTLRKTFAMRVYDANGRSEDALVMLSKIFNHRDIATTRRYIGLTAKRIENIYLSI